MEYVEKWDITVDCLIVGTGFAGLTCAIELGNSNLSILIIEKMSNAGGNSIISDGGIAAPNTFIQNKHGVKDSKELMFEDMLDAGKINDQELVRTLVEEASDAFDWVVHTLKVPFMDRVDIFGGHSVRRCYTPVGVSGNTIIKSMLKKLHQEILYKTYLKRIIKDKDQVIGAVILKDYNYKTKQGHEVYVKVRKGLILATGGYGADVHFRQKYDSRLDERVQTTNKPFATADVLKMAIAIGAATVDLSEIQLGAWASPDEVGFGVGPLFADYILFQFGIIVDKSGQRFVNEMGDRAQVSDALLSVGEPSIGITSEQSVKMSGWDISAALKRDVVRVFDTLEEVQKYYQIDERIIETVKDYNDCINIGIDRTFGKKIQKSNPLISPPFYCMRLWPKLHYTMGGLKINNQAKVLDSNNKPIQGLYAIGEVAGGVHGKSRLGSCAITECIVFGRIAARELKQES